MNRQEILEKAIKKALAGGWTSTPWNGWGTDEYDVVEDGTIYQYDGDGEYIVCPVETVIFNHDFAKALWPGQLSAGTKIGPKWYFHLQEMVVSDDPIEYLGKYLG